MAHPVIERIVAAVKGVSVKRIAATLLETFTPEILQRRKTVTKRLGHTAYLDGLRGVAAFCVVLMHLLSYTHPGVEVCYGSLYYWGHVNHSVLSLPFIRAFVLGGHFAVQLFFVISGYVLPRRLIQLLHEGRREGFIENVHSAMVRRPFRLFLPILWSTLAFAMSWHMFGLETPWPAHQANIILEIVEWINESSKFVFFFRRGDLYTRYNTHSWTIPVELQGSMFIYLWLFLTHTIDTRRRVLLTLGMVIYLAIGAAGAWYAGFFAGMLTAELDMLAADGSTTNIQFPWDGFRRWLNVHRRIKQTLLHVMLVCGLFLAGEPSLDGMNIEGVFEGCIGWETLSKLIPPAYSEGQYSATYRWFWLFWGAWMVLVAVKEIDWVRWLFETRPSQYLGKHSFSLYFVHGPMIGILSERLFYLTAVKQPIDFTSYVRYGPIYDQWHGAAWWPFPDSDINGLEPNFLFCCAISIPVFLYVAELGTKWFDTPSVAASKWIYLEVNSMR
ncbi:hypothetical protein LTR85_011802 [Meristemomyces frigidus]|nr:hypothetical protein LTR85_011802 [Meristemomyces frigidus]